MKTKKAWLLVWISVAYKKSWKYDINADLVFSSVEKFIELDGPLEDSCQLVEINVPFDYDWWDFMPDNY